LHQHQTQIVQTYLIMRFHAQCLTHPNVFSKEPYDLLR